ncbi:hypothetical protein KEM52_004033 [Ascosphaera acerosa]|nr:hypothetical protein KEM52_004033 [Ascosphaera acerosa]
MSDGEAGAGAASCPSQGHGKEMGNASTEDETWSLSHDARQALHSEARRYDDDDDDESGIKTMAHAMPERLSEQRKDDQSPQQQSSPPKDDEEASRSQQPPLPSEEEEDGECADGTAAPASAQPPLPPDDGWDPVWDETTQRYYFYNRLTGKTQWENPRAPPGDPAGDGGLAGQGAEAQPIAEGYNPAIHGDYDPTAPYAQQHKHGEEEMPPVADPSLLYAATNTLNGFRGQWASDAGAGAGALGDHFNEESRRRRQLDAFFDVDAAANAHDGRSLRAERSAKRLSKKELKQFNKRRKERKEEKRRAWLRD